MDILIRPIVTEKMERLTGKLNQYGFIVDKRANKFQIKDAIQDMYGVTVDRVNTMRYAGKRKSRYTRTGVVTGRTNSYKKAVVTLKAGDKIDFFSNI
mgnify:CR=1 FL=1